MRNKGFRSHPARVRPIVTQRDYEAAREVLRRAAHQIFCDEDEERVEALLREIDDFEVRAQIMTPPAHAGAATSYPGVAPAEVVHSRRWSDPLAAPVRRLTLLVRLVR